MASVVVLVVYWSHETRGGVDSTTLGASVAAWKTQLQSASRLQVLCVLLVAHALQLLLCFPFPNVTKTMYGYFFGAWQGAVVSLCWETALLAVFLLVFMHCAQSYPGPRFLNSLAEYLEARRSSAFFRVLLVLLSMSSLPVATKAALVLSLAVTPVEFVAAGVASALVTSARDACLGDFMSRSRSSAAEIPFYAFVICFNALLPTCISVWILFAVSKHARAGFDAAHSRDTLSSSGERELGDALPTVDDNSHSVDTVSIEVLPDRDPLGPEALGPEALGPEALRPEALGPEALRPEALAHGPGASDVGVRGSDASDVDTRAAAPPARAEPAAAGAPPDCEISAAPSAPSAARADPRPPPPPRRDRIRVFTGLDDASGAHLA